MFLTKDAPSSAGSKMLDEYKSLFAMYLTIFLLTDGTLRRLFAFDVTTPKKGNGKTELFSIVWPVFHQTPALFDGGYPSKKREVVCLIICLDLQSSSSKFQILDFGKRLLLSMLFRR